MVQYTDEQRFFIYAEKEKRTSYTDIQRLFLQKFGIPAPNRASCYKIYQKVTTNYTAQNLNRGRSGRRRSVRTDDNVLAVMDSILENPDLGTRRRAPSLDMSRTTLRTILKKDLSFKAYRYRMHQELRTPDYQRRMDFGNWFLGQHAADPHFEDRIQWTDEAHIHLSGYINSQNAIHWGSRRPDDVVTTSLHPTKVTIWCAMSTSGVIGPYFYEDQNQQPLTVNSTRYVAVLDNFHDDLQWATLLDPHLNPLTHQWTFMQDAATPHTANISRDRVQLLFNQQTIGARLTHDWPARSPDLTPMDFFFWGWMKDRVYEKLPLNNRQQLRQAVKDVVASIDPQFCENACRSVKRRAFQMLNAQGGHFEHLR